MAHPANRTLHVPAPLRRNNSSSFSAFSEIPSLPAFLNNCNLSQYLQSFNDAGAADDALPLMIDFDDDELRSVMEAVPMKPFHAVTFRKGIRELRERSRLGSMHFDNSQTSFMQPSKSSAQPTSQAPMPTPSQVLQSGSVYQHVGPAPRSATGNQPAQPVPLFSEEQPNLQRSNSK
ncbi:hypothetical protein BGZ70_004577, partial [Mortierella alpina]